MKAITLLSSRPDLVAQMHPTKNSHIDLGVVGLWSHKKPVWVCEKNHEWPAAISDRVSGCGCPYCGGKKVLPEDSFAIKYPEIAKEWHPFKNKLKSTEVTSFSSKIVWWKCSLGHEWEARVATRTMGGSKCEFCLGKRATLENNLLIKFPEIAKDWHPTKNIKLPTDYLPYSNKPVWWICKKNHSYIATPADRTYRHRGCSVCHPQDSRLQLFLYCELKHFYAVEYKHKINGFECDIYLPDYKIAIETDAHWWHKDRYDYDKKKADKLQELGITLINVREDGLNEVSGYTIRYKDSDDKLETTKKLFAMLYSLIKDDQLLMYATLKEPLNGTHYFSQVANYPAPLLENSLEISNPELAKLWDYDKNGNLKPSDVLPKSNMEVNWKCKTCGHTWVGRVSCQDSKKRGCLECYKTNLLIKTKKT